MIDPSTEKPFTDPDGRPVRDPAEIELDAEWIRSRMAPLPVPGQIKTPDDIIADLEFAKHAAGKAALIIRDADKTRRAVRRRHAIEHGKALRASAGKSAEIREADAAAATEELLQLVDVSEIAYTFARDVARTVEGSVSAVQTQSKMIAITFQLAGTGREQ